MNLRPCLSRCLRFSPFSTAAAVDFKQCNKAISCLLRQGRLADARKLFDEMPRRNVVTWNSLLRGYVQHGEIVRARKLFDQMPQRDVVSWNIMISAYVSGRGCGNLQEGRHLFDKMPYRDTVSWNTMISGYARNRRMADALRLFELMPERNIVSWNAMISGFLHNGDVAWAVELFERMPCRDSASVSALISGLVENGKLDEATALLARIREVDGERDLLDAYNTLIAGYGQIGKVETALKLFDWIPCRNSRKSHSTGEFTRNIISWNTMLMCYVKDGDMVSARKLFDEMPEKDLVSWNTVISGYVHVLDLEAAARLFSTLQHPDSWSWNLMISGYAQKGELETALDFFERMPEKSLVSWNSMIAGYEENGDYEGAIGLFVRMQLVGEKPDRHTYSSVLGACAGLTALLQGMQIHLCVTKTILADVPVNNALITMYAKCGNIVDARSLFDSMMEMRDVVSWNSMIGGYAQHGFANEALELFREMKAMKVRPTHITFVSVLNACDHAGLVEEGQRQFDSMIHEFGITPGVEHYSSLVDIIGRHGQLKDAMEVINKMPMKPDRSVWGALLGACKVHNDMDTACVAAEALMLVEPESSTPYVLLHNTYVDAERWEDAAEVRMKMESNKVRKQTGYSWIQLHGKVHVFLAGDQSHPQTDVIIALLESCNQVMGDFDHNLYLHIFTGD